MITHTHLYYLGLNFLNAERDQSRTASRQACQAGSPCAGSLQALRPCQAEKSRNKKRAERREACSVCWAPFCDLHGAPDKDVLVTRSTRQSHGQSTPSPSSSWVVRTISRASEALEITSWTRYNRLWLE